MFFENVISLDDTVSQAVRQHFTGTFHTSDTWGDGDLELHLSERGILTGSFTTEGITFGLKGTVSYTGVVYGYLLEPDASIPVALLRIQTRDQSLSLEVHVPEFTELLSESNPEKVLFERKPASVLEELLVSN